MADSDMLMRMFGGVERSADNGQRVRVNLKTKIDELCVNQPFRGFILRAYTPRAARESEILTSESGSTSTCVSESLESSIL